MNHDTSLVSVRLITDDVDGLTAFYERLTGVSADRPSPEFAEVRTPRGTLAIGSTRTVQLFGPGSAAPASNRTAIVEFRVEDADALFAGLDDTVEVVTPPTTMPWGNRSLLVRDPDGTLVNCFHPVSPEALAKFA